MMQQDPTHYTDVSREEYDRFKVAAKTKGMNISGDKDDVEFDHIPVHIEYHEDDKTLALTSTTPFWLSDAVVVGALHALVSNAMKRDTPKDRENPNFVKEHLSQEKKNGDTVHKKK